MIPAGHVLIGQVVGVFGIKGALKVESRTDFPERFAEGARVFLDGQARRVLGASWHKGQARVQLEGITSPEEAQKLRGRLITVPEEEIPKLGPDTYLAKDLVGCRVVDARLGAVGSVESVERGALYDMLQVGDALIPAIKEFVEAVDLEARVIRVRLIEGMEPGAKQ